MSMPGSVAIKRLLGGGSVILGLRRSVFFSSAQGYRAGSKWV